MTEPFEKLEGSSDPRERYVAKLLAVLDRHDDDLQPAMTLASAFVPAEAAVPVVPLTRTVFCLDSSVFLQLAKRENTDLVDYLTSDRTGPLVLPQQAVVEFWNNHDAYVDDVATKIQKAYKDLDKAVQSIDPQLKSSMDDFAAVLGKFKDEFGFLLDQQTATELQTTLGLIAQSARTSGVPRSRFRDVARSRRYTKTPPGFRDGGDGDFFVWADLLLAVIALKEESVSFDGVVLLTRDGKKDWSRGGAAHPYLVAEVKALTGKTFETWDLVKLKKRISKESADV